MIFFNALRALFSPDQPLAASAILSDPRQLAARTAWGEARGEGTLGMHGVLSVQGNRAAHPGFWGHSIATVCTAHNQFSCMRVGDPNFALLMAVTTKDPQFSIAFALAGRLIAGTLEDVTNGADSYFAIGTPRPTWAKGAFYRCTIGHHEFYRVGVRGDGQ